MVSVSVSFVGALRIVWWAVVRAVFGRWVGWEGGRGVGGESRNRETFSMRTITKGRCRRWDGECGLSVIHDDDGTDEDGSCYSESNSGSGLAWTLARHSLG